MNYKLKMLVNVRLMKDRQIFCIISPMVYFSNQLYSIDYHCILHFSILKYSNYERILNLFSMIDFYMIRLYIVADDDVGYYWIWHLNHDSLDHIDCYNQFFFKKRKQGQAITKCINIVFKKNFKPFGPEKMIEFSNVLKEKSFLLLFFLLWGNLSKPICLSNDYSSKIEKEKLWKEKKKNNLNCCQDYRERIIIIND